MEEEGASPRCEKKFDVKGERERTMESPQNL
jgi:hypothetical protein